MIGQSRQTFEVGRMMLRRPPTTDIGSYHHTLALQSPALTLMRCKHWFHLIACSSEHWANINISSCHETNADYLSWLRQVS